ncbi:MAG: sugar transferase, partial [Cyanobacteria bacterium J06635_10]
MQEALSRKEWVTLKSQEIIKSIPKLLLLTDIIGLFSCLGFTFWLRFDRTIDGLNPTTIGFILLALGTLYLADTYKPDKQIAGLRAPARIILSNIFVAVVSTAIIYLSGAWRNNPLLWRSVLLPTLALFTVWAVTLRIWTASLIRQYAQQSRWLILGKNKNTIQFAQDFQAYNSLAHLLVLEESDNSDFPQHSSPSGQEYIVSTITDLPELMSQCWTGVLLGSQIKLSDTLVQQLMA